MAVLLATGGVVWPLTGADKRALPDDLRAVMVKTPLQLAPVRLVDQQGRALTEKAFTGHWTFVTFGFTHCPDVCPATLAQFGLIKQALAQQQPALAQPRFVFVSVDPQRDTPARLSTYLSVFEPGLIGVTGEAAQIEALEQSFPTFHRKESSDASGHYSVSHSGEIFLLDPTGRVVARFVPPVTPALLARQFRSILSLAHESGAGAAPNM